jgi:hypothetical protein
MSIAAEKTTVTITKDVPAVTLTLPEDYANALVDVLASISGSRINSRRKFTGEILDALYAAGFTLDNHRSFDLSGVISFVPEELF